MYFSVNVQKKWLSTLYSVLVKDISVHLIVIVGNKHTFIHWPVFPKNTFNGWWKIWNLIGSIINLQNKDLQICPRSVLKPLSFALVGRSLSTALAGKAYQPTLNSATSQDKGRKVSFPIPRGLAWKKPVVIWKIKDFT